MLFLLPATLLAFAFVQVSAYPVDTDPVTCNPIHLATILGPSYATSSTVGAYCGELLLSDIVNTPLQAPTTTAPSSTLDYPSTTVRVACECVLLAFQEKAKLASDAALKGLGSGFTAEEQELRMRGGESWEPYGRGAVPAPLGSELKGFGARDNLYIRGGVVDGFRTRME